MARNVGGRGRHRGSRKRLPFERRKGGEAPNKFSLETYRNRGNKTQQETENNLRYYSRENDINIIELLGLQDACNGAKADGLNIYKAFAKNTTDEIIEKDLRDVVNPIGQLERKRRNVSESPEFLEKLPPSDRTLTGVSRKTRLCRTPRRSAEFRKECQQLHRIEGTGRRGKIRNLQCHHIVPRCWAYNTRFAREFDNGKNGVFIRGHKHNQITNQDMVLEASQHETKFISPETGLYVRAENGGEVFYDPELAEKMMLWNRDLRIMRFGLPLNVIWEARLGLERPPELLLEWAA